MLHNLLQCAVFLWTGPSV